VRREKGAEAGENKKLICSDAFEFIPGGGIKRIRDIVSRSVRREIKRWLTNVRARSSLLYLPGTYVQLA